MTQTLLEMAKDLTRSVVETGSLSSENMQAILQQTHSTLRALIHAAANFASFSAFRGLSTNESILCFMV